MAIWNKDKSYLKQIELLKQFKMKKIYHIFLLAAVLVCISQSSVKPSPAIVQQIQKVYTKPWYSGYLDVKDTKLQQVVHHMHYFFFPSQSNPTTDPILFWFNGGPGCSSLLGALYEHGPFLINDAFGMLMNNKFSWNKNSSVVYIESPSEVGFSYIDNKPDGYAWNDQDVSLLNRDSVIQFFNVWKEYNGLKTFIAGQSYAGIYVPTLFEKLHDYNLLRAPQSQINIQGFAVGNGCTHLTECEFQNDYGPYLMQLYRDYGFITQQMYENVESKCANQGQDLPDDCKALLDKIDNMMTGINIYDAYRPCYQNNANLSSSQLSFKEMRRLALRKRTKQNNSLSWAPPCVDSLGLDKILLNKEIRANLSIPTKVQQYSMCNANDDFLYDRSITGSYRIYKRLIPLNKYRIIKYSGDSDPAVPTSGTLMWVNLIRKELQLPTAQYWKPWFTSLGSGLQNGGNLWELTNNFKLVTFKGIGHMAPQWNIEGGQKVINHLMWDTPL